MTDEDPFGEGRRELPVRAMSEILEDPEALRPPEPVVPQMAWKGRVSLLAAREKLGKSTLAAAAAAAVSRGRQFLGEPVERGSALVLALEEHVADVVGRLVDFDADPDRVFIMDRIGEDPVIDLANAVALVGPRLAVVDTLAAFVRPLGLEPGNATAWTAALTPVAHVARDTDTAIHLLHHADKARNEYRDSTAIGATVDVIMEMKEGTGDGERKVKARGRFRVSDFSVRKVGTPGSPRFELASGELSVDARVLRYVRAHPGASKRKVRQGVTGKARTVDDALRRLEGAGAIQDRGDDRGSAWHEVEDGQPDLYGRENRQDPCGARSDTVSDTVGGESGDSGGEGADAQDPGGHATDTVGHGAGHGGTGSGGGTVSEKAGGAISPPASDTPPDPVEEELSEFDSATGAGS